MYWDQQGSEREVCDNSRGYNGTQSAFADNRGGIAANLGVVAAAPSKCAVDAAILSVSPRRLRCHP
jgi:hypothetical protein